ncbi:hypothetical protein CPB84DRAFT_1759915 [Gymnopilus junonius]|uniref:RNA-binding domain-containing protein n=1 Tax=Gymnopilus junonius TaxID=109634 RepID=A0A9P5NYG0_GYMJU|nr:hypothetical protein CPB84DRAFT_1759915 [Gymnopilus junonius]
MAAPSAVDDSSMRPDSWAPQEDQPMGPGSNPQSNTGPSLPVDDRSTAQDPENPEYPRGSSVSENETFREKQVKPNKVYIGGLPEHTRHEDLQNCFGKIGNIINIELKVGYGFVEFDTREAAEESVAKYHEGFFMGNKIRVELSHGGGRTAKFAGDPGACFKCGQMGHWARECPNNSGPDDFPPQRLPPRDSRYDYPAPPAAGRDHRRPPSPREYRDYPPPPGSRVREYDDFRRGPPPVDDRDRFVPPSDFRGRFPPGPDAAFRSYGPPPPQVYDRYDRRPTDRYTPYSQPPGARPRSPPRVRDDYERVPSRDYPEYRGRPPSPPRYPPDFGRMGANSPPARYRRRSASPGRPGPPYDGYSMNGYVPGPVVPAPAPAAPPRGARDYAPRNNREIIEPIGSYRRP